MFQGRESEALLWQRRKRTTWWWAGARRKLRRTVGRHVDCVVELGTEQELLKVEDDEVI